MDRIALVAALALTALAGCGSDVDPDTVKDAAGETADAGSARIEWVSRSTFAGEEHEFRGHGVVDYANERSMMEFDSGRTIVVGDMSYSEVGGLEPELPAGKRWVRVDLVEARAEFEDAADELLDEEDASTSIHFFFGAGGYQSDPGRLLDDLVEAGSLPEHVGSETVRGVECERYQLELDSRALLRQSLEEAEWSERAIDLALDSLSPEPIEAVVCVDADDRVRRIVTTSRSGGGTVTTTTEYFDFGVDADIEAPPESEVVDADEGGWTSYGPLGADDNEEAGSRP